MSTIIGTHGEDSLAGTTGDDLMRGLASDDRMFGDFGDDRMFGGDGDDFIDGYEDADTIRGGLGNDRLFGGDGPDLLYGGDGDDLLNLTVPGLEDIRSSVELGNRMFGGDGDDTVLIYIGNAADGEAGHDYVELQLERLDDDGIVDRAAYKVDLRPLDWGGTASFHDTQLTGFEAGVVIGGVGDDVIRVGRMDISAHGLGGDDRISVGGSNFANGGSGDDHIRGGAGANHLMGGEGSDTLIGGRGDDTLNGGQNADLLISGEDGAIFRAGGGGDRLEIAGASVVESGGGGADQLVFLNVGALNTLVENLGLTDVIDLAAIDADTTAGGDQAFVLVEDFSGAAGEMRLVAIAGDTFLQVDRDGDGAADAETLELEGEHADYDNFVP